MILMHSAYWHVCAAAVTGDMPLMTCGMRYMRSVLCTLHSDALCALYFDVVL